MGSLWCDQSTFSVSLNGYLQDTLFYYTNSHSVLFPENWPKSLILQNCERSEPWIEILYSTVYKNHQNSLIWIFTPKMAFLGSIGYFCNIWIFAPKIIKIVLFEFSRQKWHLFSSIVNFWNIWIFAPKIIKMLIFGAKIQIYPLRK